jgi:hypothetical protein
VGLAVPIPTLPDGLIVMSVVPDRPNLIEPVPWFLKIQSSTALPVK